MFDAANQTSVSPVGPGRARAVSAAVRDFGKGVVMNSESDAAKRQTGSVESAALVGRRHEEQHGHYSHQMTEETKEAAGRAVVRIVPVLYGFLLGGLSGDIVLWVLLGSVLAVVIDLKMGEHSLSRPLLGRASLAGCPVVAAMAHWLSRRIASIGGRPPALLRDMRCGVG